MSRRVFYGLLLILPFAAGCSGDDRFPDDQKIEGPWKIPNDKEKVIEFNPALETSSAGLQGLYLLVDSRKYKEGQDTEEATETYFFPRTKGEETLLKPEVVLIAENGDEIELSPGAYNYARDESLLGVGFGPSPKKGEIATSFSDHADSYIAVRIRSNRPFSLKKLQWKMDKHPDFHTCGGHCPWWMFWN